MDGTCCRSILVCLFFSLVLVHHPHGRHSSAEIQLQRLMLRDNCSRSEASPRLNSQLPITSKVAYADIVIDNSGTRSELEDQVLLCVKRLQRGKLVVPSFLGAVGGLDRLMASGVREKEHACRRHYHDNSSRYASRWLHT